MSDGSSDLVKLPAFQRMLEDFCVAVGVTVAFVDDAGEILARHPPPRICRSFCDLHPGRCQGCFKHDPRRLREACADGGPVYLQARGGMVDAVTPVVIPGLPAAHAVIGPMFLERSDLEFFRREAVELGLDVQDWMEAAAEIPVIGRARLDAIIDIFPAFFDLAGTMDRERARARSDLAAAGARLQHAERTEEELRESEEKFAAIFHTSALAIVLSRLDTGRILDVNEAFEQATGHSRDEVLGRTTLEIGFWAEPEVRASVFAELEKSDSVTFEFVMRRRDGQLRTMIGSTRKVTIAGALCIASVLHDITERKKTELALRESEDRHRTYFEAAADAIVVVRARDGVVTDCNASAVALLGCDHRDQVIGAEAISFCPPSQPDGRPSLIGAREMVRAARDGNTQPFAWEFERRRDKARLSAEVSVNVLRKGDDMSLLVLARDVTERRQLDERLRQVQRIEVLGQLAGGVAHDVNNLLTPIIGYATLLQHRMGPDDPLRADACAIVEAGGRCRDVVRQLLTFARRQAMRMTAVDLNQVVSGFQATVTRSLREHVRVITRLQAAPATMMGDPGQLEQLILNLALNAQDAMPDGGQLAIETSRQDIADDDDLQQEGLKAGPYVRLAITDTGTGMDEATRARAFEPFFTTKASGKGTGLGLATVHGIVKQHGGHAVIDSAPGKGTTVRIYFPLLDRKLETDVVPASDQPAARGHETILVVEDHDDVRAITIELLGRSGYRVLEARDGATAQQVVGRQETPIDLLLTDVVLPDTNGRTLHERLAESRPGLRVLYMSGYPADIVGRHGSADPNAVYLQKPFMPGDLATKVREALKGR